jgi:WhiB family redox-sensing transcriptional regulator
MDWRASAACRVEDPELFFPIGTTEPALRQTREAKTICAGCPAKGQCLSWALESNQDTGVWGGLGEHERRSLRRRALRAGAGKAAVDGHPPLSVNGRSGRPTNASDGEDAGGLQRLEGAMSSALDIGLIPTDIPSRMHRA